MPLVFAFLFLAVSIYFILQFFGVGSSEQAHLPESALTPKSEIDIKLQEGLVAPRKSWFGLSKRFKPLDQRIKAGGLRRRLIRAGSPMGVIEFLFLKLLCLITLPVIAFIFLGPKFSPEILFIGSLLIGFLLPELWLKRQIKIRQHNMRKELPNIIDLLNLCVGGGMDFMLAVSRVVKELRTSDLTRELSEVYRQTQMGKTRREALKDLAWRIDMPEMHSFVRTLVQADRMGSPLSEALKLQAEEIRTRRFHRGEAMALKAPIKLLFPLFAFILPVVLVIVGGPIILDFVRNKMNFGF